MDKRFLKTSGVDAYTGNELLVKGALEAGVGLITGYPGSPVSDVFDTLAHVSPLLTEKGIVAQIANNEGLSAARLNGARQSGLRAMAVMKSVGFHVAADALAVGNLMEFKKEEGGALVVVGDDPWNETTQINSDSRYLSKHLNMPLIEPSTFQEIKDWINIGFKISGFSDLFATFLITTNQADGGATVNVHPHPDLPINRNNQTTLSSDQIKISDSVLIPPHTSMREATLKKRQQRFLKAALEWGLNRIEHQQNKRVPVGFVTSGLSYCYLEEVLKLLGLWGTLPVLKLGVTYPLDRELVAQLAKQVDHMVVVEEKRGFLEEQVSEIFRTLKQDGVLAKVPALWGKVFPDGKPGFPQTRGLNVSILLETLGPAFLRWKDYFPSLNVTRIEKELAEIINTSSSSFEVPLRTPTFCPGCPHRDSAVVGKTVKENFIKFDYMEKKNKKPSDVIFHGESGCHSMLQFAPFEGLMQNYSGMGLGGGTGAGMSPFVTNKQVVFLGDSTFFHSGLVAISDSVKNNQDITYVILENDTTAMTGHQPTPANDRDVMGNTTHHQNIERILKGMLPETVPVVRVDPSKRDAYQTLMEDLVAKPGVKVVISEKECAITYQRRERFKKNQIKKEHGFLPVERKINIAQDVCEYCLECTKQTACPGLTVEKTPYGPKINTDLSTCVEDKACARVKACPSFEELTIERSNRPKKKTFDTFDLESIPAPRINTLTHHRWCAYTAGVGGMGAGVVNAVLVRAGIRAGFDVNFLDKKGLAIRNGGVYGHVVFSSAGPVGTPVIPYGKADLLIGLDMLEAARAMDARMNLRVAHPGRTRAVVNNHENQTVTSLMGKDEFNAEKLEPLIQSKIRLGEFLSGDFSRLSEKYIGSKLYANMMIIGAAYQMGALPLTNDQLTAAIDESVKPSEAQNNHLAFKLGRYSVMHPELLRSQEKVERVIDVVDQKTTYLKKSSFLFGRKRAKAYRKLIDQVYRWIDLPGDYHTLLARMIYDLILYDNLSLAKEYVALVWKTYKKDQKRFKYEVTKTVIKNLFRAMAIKDEVWVATLLTRPEKYEQDRERYKIDLENGDKVTYRHFNRPHFPLFGMDIKFDIVTKDWMLKIMSRAKFLRRLLPQWHAKEKKFRDWYVSLIEQFNYFKSSDDYRYYLEALKQADQVKGYREIRYKTMDQAVRSATVYLNYVGKKTTPKTTYALQK